MSNRKQHTNSTVVTQPAASDPVTRAVSLLNSLDVESRRHIVTGERDIDDSFFDSVGESLHSSFMGMCNDGCPVDVVADAICLMARAMR